MQNPTPSSSLAPLASASVASACRTLAKLPRTACHSEEREPSTDLPLLASHPISSREPAEPTPAIPMSCWSPRHTSTLPLRSTSGLSICLSVRPSALHSPSPARVFGRRGLDASIPPPRVPIAHKCTLYTSAWQYCTFADRQWSERAATSSGRPVIASAASVRSAFGCTVHLC